MQAGDRRYSFIGPRSKDEPYENKRARHLDEHQGAYPCVAFFVGGAAPELIISINRTAGVGVRSDGTGLAQIFGASDLDLLRFAETALRPCAILMGPRVSRFVIDKHFSNTGSTSSAFAHCATMPYRRQ
jgi:hypothetical protein